MRRPGYTLFSFCLYSQYVCCKPVICTFFYFFSMGFFFWRLAFEALLERSVSGSEHVVVFSFVMPWVLWTSWGRYCMEGNQQRESGPANRLHVQVLDNSCFHRASLESTSVQGPERRLHMDAKSFFTSQICFLRKHPCIFLVSVWWLLFGTEQSFTPPTPINGRRKRHIFLSGFIGWSPVTHSVNIIIKKKK